MRKYETTYIIDGSVSDTDREALIEKIENVLTGNGSEIDRTVRWGKRQLAYEIKKQSRGYYVILYYNAEPSVISSFHHELDLNERILRYLTLLSDGKHPDYIRDAGISTDMSAAPQKAPEIAESSEDTEEEPLGADEDTVENISEEASEIIESSEDTGEEPLGADEDTVENISEEAPEIIESSEDTGEEPLGADEDTVENISEEASEIIESSEATVEEPLESDIDMGEIIPEENNSEEAVNDEEQPEDSDTEVTEESVIEEVSDEADNQNKEEE